MSTILSILFSLERVNCPGLTCVTDIAPVTLYFSLIASFPVLFVSFSVSYIRLVLYCHISLCFSQAVAPLREKIRELELRYVFT